MNQEQLLAKRDELARENQLGELELYRTPMTFGGQLACLGWNRRRMVMKVKMVAVVVGIILLLSALTGCSDIQKGYIIAKNSTPARSYYTPGYSTDNCEKVGKKEECEEEYHPGVWHYSPATWELDISNCTPQRQQQNNNCQTNGVDVSEDTYNKYNVGDYVDLSNQ